MIAILEDDLDRVGAMRACLQRHFPDHEALFFDNAPQMVGWLDGCFGELPLD